MKQAPDRVGCKVCGRLFAMLTATHLSAKHQLSFDSYFERFPGERGLTQGAAIQQLRSEKFSAAWTPARRKRVSKLMRRVAKERFTTPAWRARKSKLATEQMRKLWAAPDSPFRTESYTRTNGDRLRAVVKASHADPAFGERVSRGLKRYWGRILPAEYDAWAEATNRGLWSKLSLSSGWGQPSLCMGKAFRSQVEARFAAFLQHWGETPDWQYEPWSVAWQDSNGRTHWALVDFYVPSLDVVFEVGNSSEDEVRLEGLRSTGLFVVPIASGDAIRFYNSIPAADRPAITKLATRT